MSKAKSEVAKLIIIVWVVAGFVTPGYEHSIANAGIFTMALAAPFAASAPGLQLDGIVGNPVAHVGLGVSDRTQAGLGISYQMNEHYSLDFGLDTTQAPLTATGQVRFPWLSFGSWATNSTSLYLSLSAAY